MGRHSYRPISPSLSAASVLDTNSIITFLKNGNQDHTNGATVALISKVWTVVKLVLLKNRK
jgi:hypothetical protein